MKLNKQANNNVKSITNNGNVQNEEVDNTGQLNNKIDNINIMKETSNNNSQNNEINDGIQLNDTVNITNYVGKNNMILTPCTILKCINIDILKLSGCQ